MTKILFAAAALLLSLSGIASAAVDPAGVANPAFAANQALTERHVVAWAVGVPTNATRADEENLPSDHNDGAKGE